MSYSGYDQKLCNSGHLTYIGVYDGDIKCWCGEGFKWENAVNCTNDEGFPYDDFKLLNEVSKCESCLQYIPEIYSIPTEDEMAAFEIRREEFFNNQE